MLKSLHFQNIALFGNLEIDFDKGFTVFTGQTGSGKSIFIDTLNALLVNKKTSLDNRLVAKGFEQFELLKARNEKISTRMHSQKYKGGFFEKIKTFFDEKVD